MITRQRPLRFRGISTIEFAIGFPVFLFLICTILQLALLYQAKTVLDMATLAAARSGAIHNADRGKMRDALAIGLTPLASRGTDIVALGTAYATLSASNLLFTQLDVLNPTPQSFNDHSVMDKVGNNNVRVIPNDNLTYRDPAVKSASRQNVQDANVLRVRVTYGHRLVVPLVREFFKSLQYLLYAGAPSHPAWLLDDRIPLTSYATVRMQSPAMP